MTLEVRFVDEAAAELQDAAAWYQLRSEGLGLVLLSVIAPQSMESSGGRVLDL